MAGESRGIIWGNVRVLAYSSEWNKTSVLVSLYSGRDLNLGPAEYDAVLRSRHASFKCSAFKYYYFFSLCVSHFPTCFNIFMRFILTHTCNPFPYVERFVTCLTIFRVLKPFQALNRWMYVCMYVYVKGNLFVSHFLLLFVRKIRCIYLTVCWSRVLQIFYRVCLRSKWSQWPHS